MNKVYSINGPVVKVKQATEFQIMEMVFVGEKRLLGEVISISEEFTVIQVYESTVGLKPGEEIISTGEPISVTLGPGLLTNIFDGIQRPLKKIYDKEGQYIQAGTQVDVLDYDKKWDVKLLVKEGDTVTFGQVFGEIQETSLIIHRLLVPKGVEGEVVSVKKDGLYDLREILVVVKDKFGNNHELTMVQRWPIKKPRPTKYRLPLTIPLVSGQRVIDTLFPIAKGGTAGVPGGFGT